VTGQQVVTGWRVALRVARREAWRAKGRSVLVLVMIMVPVAALASAAVVSDTFTLSPAERADRLMGAAQAAIVWPVDSPVSQDPADLTAFGSPSAGPAPATTAAAPPVQRLLALLPPGTRVIEEQRGTIWLRTAAGTGQLGVRLLDYADPLARGMLRPLSGRAPAGPDDVALTPAAASRLGTGPGGTVRLADGSRELRVVGTVEDPADLTAATVVLRPAALPQASLANGRADLRWLVATPEPLTWADVKRLNTHGVVAVSRYVLAHPPTSAERYPGFAGGHGLALGLPGIGGGLAVLEIILLAGPAFAVGARRRRRDLALVAAAGATPSQLRRIVLADGVVLGAAAAASGIVLGIAAAAAARPLIEEHLYHVRSGGFRVYPLALAALAALAVLTGLLAALVPAWVAARQDVVTALAGRRGITRSRRRWVVLGATLGAAGAGIAGTGAWRISSTIILAGLAVAELGLILCTPAVIGLVARLGRVLPLGPRIALRDSSRNRTAAAPAVSAVMAAVVGSLAVGVVLNASTARTGSDYRSAIGPGDVVLDHNPKLTPDGPEPVPASAVAALRSTLPVDRVHAIGVPACGAGECYVTPQVPAAQACPYAGENLRHDPTPEEQRAARRDPRCDGLGQVYHYFNTGYGDLFTAIVDDGAVGAVTGLPPADADPAAAALRAGKVVVDHPRFLDHGTITLSVSLFQPFAKRPAATREVTLPAVALPHRPRALNIGTLIQAAPQIFGEVMGEMFGLLAAGVLGTGQPTTYPLADGPKALAELEARATVGKLALVP
jgi:putative ABC transport system permease protein